MVGNNGDFNVPAQESSLNGDEIKVFPDTSTSGKDGIVSGTTNQGLNAHAIQTPGKDTTVAEAQVAEGNKKEQMDVNTASTGGVVDTQGAGGDHIAGNDLKKEEGDVGLGHGETVGTVNNQSIGVFDGGKGNKSNLVGVQPIAEVSCIDPSEA